MKQEELERIIRFAETVGKLKTTPRRGWNRLPVGESVADHTCRLCLLVYAVTSFEGTDVDAYRCLRMALLHDVAECIIGDITPHDGISQTEKYRREAAAISQLADLLGDQEMSELWVEFEENKTAESQLVRELDFLETLLQAMEYERECDLSSSVLQEFWDAGTTNLASDLGKRIYEYLRTRRGESE